MWRILAAVGVAIVFCTDVVTGLRIVVANEWHLWRLQSAKYAEKTRREIAESMSQYACHSGYNISRQEQHPRESEKEMTSDKLPEYAEVTISAVLFNLQNAGCADLVAERLQSRMVLGELSAVHLNNYAKQLRREADRLAKQAEALDVAAAIMQEAASN